MSAPSPPAERQRPAGASGTRRAGSAPTDGAPVGALAAAPAPATAPPASGAVEEAVGLRELYEHAPCGYLTTDDAGVITRVNQTFLAWTGHDRQDLLGSELARLLPVGDRILWSASCAPQLATTGSVAEVLVEVLAVDRSRRAVLLSATRHIEPGGAGQVKVIVFGAHERRAHERDLVAALRQAQQAERARAAAEEEMRALAVLDALTGLANRRGLHEILQVCLAAGARPAVGVLVVDLDHFKAVNDSLGHRAGDDLLRTVAARLREATREHATIARLGGDEFVVAVDVADAEQAGVIASRLLAALVAPVVIEGLEIVVSASIGIAIALPDEDAEQVIHRADVAMYAAKARGRNTVQIHDPRVADPAAGRLRLLGELRAGIERGELVVHYQPRIALDGGGVCGVEALVRWNHPQRGLLAPAHFIDVAEGSGLIHRLGAVVLDAAIAQGAAWAAQGRAIEIAVNLSARQLVDPTLADAVAEMLTRHGLEAALLTLEVTETALMSDPDAALATLNALKALGTTLAVDDFGTGYASFTYLQRFPLDELKIDRSFVATMGENHGDAAIVATCVALARSLGLRSVAEGVETTAQHDALIALACDQAQGYLFSRPVPAEQLTLPITGSTAVEHHGLDEAEPAS